MSSPEENTRRHGAATPSGLPEDPVDAAQAINAELARRINLPGPSHHGLLLHGAASNQAGDTALVSIAHSLADIAISLRTLAARTDG